MKNKKLILYLSIVFIIVILLLFIFLKKDKNNKSNLRDMSISYVGADPLESFNPQKSEGYSNFLVNTVANLAVFGPNGETIPYAAEKITMSSDSKSMDVKLKSGLKFEDNTNVGSKEYLMGIKILSNPITKASYQNWATDNIIGAKEYSQNKSDTISGFEIKDDTNFTIHLKRPIRYFKDMMPAINWAPASEKYINKIGIENYGKTYKDILSSGPLKIKNHKHSQYIQYIKNDKTSLSKNIPIDNLKISFIASDIAQAKLFKNAEIDAIIQTANVDKLLGSSKPKKPQSVQSTPFMTFIASNASKVDKNVRKALNLALDKEYINKTFFNNTHSIRSVPYPSQYSDLDNEVTKNGIDVNKNEYDMNTSKKLLSNEKKKKYVFTYDESISEDVIKYIGSQAKLVGLNLDFKKIPSSVLSKSAYTKYDKSRSDYDFTLTSWGQDYTNPASFLETLFESKTNTNVANFKDDKYDKIIKDALSSKDDKTSSVNFAKAVKLIHDDNVLIPLYQRNKQYYVQPGKYITDVIGRLGIVNNWTKSK